MKFQQRSPSFVLSIFLTPAAFLDNWNSDPRGQFPDRRRKVDVLVFHYEPENASAHPTAETVKRLPLRVDVKRRRLFLMKRAERLEIRAGSFHWKIRTDYLDDVVRRCDLFNCFGRNHRLDFSLVYSLKRCQNLPEASVLSNQ